ncbi:TetR/AcrR family transcriptional regulator [Longirhabdus pacifica]|uniref:TetR/AcrR family transcriptional regulator n=1 Tax=Longirhabdus pacifica TaxID=2305227 RepID=UPI001008E1EA|nr:TetR/AcrR family transcriptional regulator [Longirhabdus pacifica]
MTVDRKQLIVQAAFKSFSLFGYKGTTMEQVAKIAKVGKGTIYTFFQNKEELFNEILHNVIMEMRDVAKSSIDKNRTFFQNLNQVLFKTLEFRRKHELMVRLYHEVKEIGTPAAMDGLKKFESEIRKFIEIQVEKAIERKEIKHCDPEITAFIIFRLYISFVSEWSSLRDELDNEKIAELFQLYLAEGLAM